MKRRFSIDPATVTRIADGAEHLAHEGRRMAAAGTALALELREMYYVISPLLERSKSK